MSDDLTEILNTWVYDPDDQYRIIEAADGREVLQVRQPLGVEQYELDGRPDGRCPFGKETVLEEIVERLSLYCINNGNDSEFSVTYNDFILLQNEAILYYYRYFILIRMGDYDRTIADTNHNLKICDLIERYVKQNENANEIVQYRPYTIRINATSKAMILLKENQHELAKGILERGILDVQNLNLIDTSTFRLERVKALRYLRSAIREIKKSRPKYPHHKLRKELQEAVSNEEYERAAKLRDILLGLI